MSTLSASTRIGPNGRRLLVVTILLLVGITVLRAVPGLRNAAREAAQVNPLLRRPRGTYDCGGQPARPALDHFTSPQADAA